MELVLKLVLSAIFAAVFAGIYFIYAKNFGVLDSTQNGVLCKEKTVSGGGVSIMLCSVLTLLIFTSSLNDMLGVLFVGGAIITLLGLIDDHYSLTASSKLLAQMFVVFFVFYLLDFPVLSLDIRTATIQFESILLIFPMIFLIWCINVHNFMDGVDGIACIEALFILPFAGLFLMDFSSLLAEYLLCVSVGVFVFLFWNLPPAKMFLGDSGSTFLGFTIGCTILIGFYVHSSIGLAIVILYGAFLTDATMTLMARLTAGKNCFKSHSEHLYQIAVRRFGTGRCLLVLSLINIFWFLPFAVFAFFMPAEAFFIALLAYFPAIVVQIYMRQYLRHGSRKAKDAFYELKRLVMKRLVIARKA